MAREAGTRTVALSGGCFQNAGLLERVCEQLEGFELCLPREAPANDGGLAYGQALVALARLESH
ncbi:[NiFe] hydrogenase metallocenter assembly protein HypF [Salipiger mucosus DSM 16094]|uniref:[NiFe] hydrogenase metallocenter assembly protein HypF n=1 Tax=Salipiger mucosus DSM 16094 TaxID=1123237 RepID=S9RQM6_9RHOB|nr:[NiFe] hydrogenase metallocenter assembly protein HypF [Salipiger mucosus DSM 16094]